MGLWEANKRMFWKRKHGEKPETLVNNVENDGVKMQNWMAGR